MNAIPTEATIYPLMAAIAFLLLERLSGFFFGRGHGHLCFVWRYTGSKLNGLSLDDIVRNHRFLFHEEPDASAAWVFQRRFFPGPKLKLELRDRRIKETKIGLPVLLVLAVASFALALFHFLNQNFRTSSAGASFAYVLPLLATLALLVVQAAELQGLERLLSENAAAKSLAERLSAFSAEVRRLRRRLLIATALYLIGTLLLLLATEPLPKPVQIGLLSIFIVGSVGSIIRYSSKLHASHCPSCGHRFFTTWWGNNIFTGKCVHCKTPLSSERK